MQPVDFAETVTFGGGGLDRAEDLRRHPEDLVRLPARTLPVWRGKPLMSEDRSALVTLEGRPFDETEALIGKVGDHALFACDVSAMAVEGEDPSGAFVDQSQQRLPGHDGVFTELRSAMSLLSPLDAEIAATAKGVLEWHRSHGFCSNCGTPTEAAKAGWMRQCPGCGRSHFPRTDPVVIMLVTHGNDCLLGRSPQWPEGFYSCLAGFMEPGETMESAVRRETWEETGVKVGSVRYVSSQPWAFPHSLMLGAWGTAISRDIQIDPEEIADAIWVSRERLMRILAGEDDTLMPARQGAIARFLLEAWLADRLPAF